jgi:hypothetical protein
MNLAVEATRTHYNSENQSIFTDRVVQLRV